MKKLILTLFAIFLASSAFLMAQTLQEKARKLLKPTDIGVTEYDAFKNSSFSLKDEVLKTDKNYDQVSKDLIRYANGSKKLTLNNVNSDIKKVKNMKGSIKSLSDKASTLAESGKKLSTGVAGVKPASKIASATTNTNSSVKAVELSREILKGLSKKVDGDMGTLNGLLTKSIGKK